MTTPNKARQNRAAILEALDVGDELCLSEVAEESAVSRRTAWSHLRELVREGLVEVAEKDGRKVWRAA